jgi:hypothetical protein
MTGGYVSLFLFQESHLPAQVLSLPMDLAEYAAKSFVHMQFSKVHMNLPKGLIKDKKARACSPAVRRAL